MTMFIQCSAQCPRAKQVLNSIIRCPSLRELILYLHNYKSIKFFPALGYNLSAVSLIPGPFGDTENKTNPSVILQTPEIAAVFH